MMVDISASIHDALDAIDGVNVYYFLPSDWTLLPALSYFEAENAEYERAGGQEYLSWILYQIEVWANSRTDILRVCGEVDTRLAAMGLKRELSCDDVESGHNLQHRKMQYGCIANQKGQIYQKNILNNKEK